MTSYDHAKLALTKEEQKNAIAFLYELKELQSEFGDDTPTAVADLIKTVRNDFKATVKAYREKAEDIRDTRIRRDVANREWQKRKREDVQTALLNIARTELQVGDNVDIYSRYGDKCSKGQVIRVTKARAYVSYVDEKTGRVGTTENVTVPRFRYSAASWNIRKYEAGDEAAYSELGESWRFATKTVKRAVNFGRNTTHTNEYHKQVAEREVYK